MMPFVEVRTLPHLPHNRNEGPFSEIGHKEYIITDLGPVSGRTTGSVDHINMIVVWGQILVVLGGVV